MPKRGVVLAGGGSRGPYQVGVWQALRELGMEYQIVTGSSVGAINAALMVQQEFDLTKQMWENLTIEGVMTDPEDLSSRQKLFLAFIKKLVERSGADITPLEQTLRRVVNEEAIRSSPIELGMVTVRFPAYHPVEWLKEDIPQGELVDYLLASAAYFPLFPRREIDGAEYIDGAYYDNMPAKLALDWGAEELVVVDLAGYGLVHKIRDGVPVTYIRCHWDLGELMVFEPAVTRRNLQLGYLDAMKAYRRLEGSAYAFHLGESRANAEKLVAVLDDMRRNTGVDLFRDYGRLIQRQEADRVRDMRFRKYFDHHYTLGRAITTAAEITGELLEIPPDRVYTMEEFNALILKRSAELSEPTALRGDRREERGHSVFSLPRAMLSSGVLRELYRQLEAACFTGGVSDAIWGLAALHEKEFAAANYILALKLLYSRFAGSTDFRR